MIHDSSEEVEVVWMVNKYFKRHDGLSTCASTTPYNEDIEEEDQGK
jgi:hypothetical protein